MDKNFNKNAIIYIYFTWPYLALALTFQFQAWMGLKEDSGPGSHLEVAEKVAAQSMVKKS